MAEAEIKEDKKVEAASTKKSSGLKKEHKEILYITLAVVVVFAAYGMGYCANHNNRKIVTGSFMANGVRGDGPVTVSSGDAIAAGGTMIGGQMGASAILNDDSTHFNGVVTAISGNNFTIGGNGASTNVVTSSSTSYQSGNSVKLNDSVIIVGTKAGDTITATKIIINP